MAATGPAGGLVTSALFLGAIGYIAKLYYEKEQLAGIESDGQKLDLLMEPLETAQIIHTTREKEVQGTLTAAGGSGPESTKYAMVGGISIQNQAVKLGRNANWWTVANELINQTADDCK